MFEGLSCLNAPGRIFCSANFHLRVTTDCTLQQHVESVLKIYVWLPLAEIEGRGVGVWAGNPMIRACRQDCYYYTAPAVTHKKPTMLHTVMSAMWWAMSAAFGAPFETARLLRSLQQ